MLGALRETLQTVLLALLLLAALHGSIQNYRVEGASMEPTLNTDQYLLVNKLVYYRIDKARLARYLPFIDAKQGDVAHLFHPPRRGDIVVFHYPLDSSRDFVKRVIGVPGDTVEIDRGNVYVNGLPHNEQYVFDLGRASLAKETLEADQYFVLGDNRPHSNDSKDWGAVSLEEIVGSGWISYWPLSHLRFF